MIFLCRSVNLLFKIYSIANSCKICKGAVQILTMTFYLKVIGKKIKIKWAILQLDLFQFLILTSHSKQQNIIFEKKLMENFGLNVMHYQNM